MITLFGPTHPIIPIVMTRLQSFYYIGGETDRAFIDKGSTSELPVCAHRVCTYSCSPSQKHTCNGDSLGPSKGKNPP